MGKIMRRALVGGILVLALQAAPTGFAVSAGNEDATKGSEETAPAIDQAPPENVQNTRGGGRPAAGQFRVNDLIGLTVISADGKDVGEVADLIVDAEAGRIEELVVESESIIGLDYTKFGVDWSQVKVESDPAPEQVTLTVTQEQMTEGFKAKSNGEVQE